MSERPLYGSIYLIEAVGAERIKIGWTGGSPLRRLQDLQHASPFPLELLAVMRGTMREERQFHQHFATARAIREWFHATPAIRALVASIHRDGGLLREAS